MVSPYLEKPLRSLEQALRDRARQAAKPGSPERRVPALLDQAGAPGARLARLLRDQRPAPSRSGAVGDDTPHRRHAA